MASRPGGVTLVAVIVWIQGLLSIIGGVLLMLASPTLGAGAAAAMTVAIITIIIGIITIAVGAALLRGSNGARILTTIVLIISLVNALVSMFSQSSTVVSSGFSAALALIGVFLLYTKSANSYFSRN